MINEPKLDLNEQKNSGSAFRDRMRNSVTCIENKTESDFNETYCNRNS